MLILKVFLLSMCAPLYTGDEGAEYASGEAGKRIVEWVKAFESAGFSGSVLAAKEGQVVAAVGVGKAIQINLSGDGKSHDNNLMNKPTTLFELASCSKPITSLCVMKLVEQGKITLDDSIAKHLPAVPDNCREITIRHLLQHTSGIPGENFEGDGTQVEKAVVDYLKGGPIHRSGTNFEYWNQGYALLSAIIARASREDDLKFTRRVIFQPTGMSSSCFTGDEAPKGAEVSAGYSLFEQSRSALDHPYGAYDLRYRGMGGVVSNVWDLWRFNVAIDDEHFLSQGSRAELFKPNAGGYALGWYVKRNNRDQLMQFHSGSVAGFLSYIARYPEQRSCIILLCNRDDLDVNAMARDVESLLFGEQPKRALPPKPVDEALRGKLVGTFQTESKQICRILLEGPVTRIHIEWAPPNGPGTTATLGIDNNRSLVIFEPSGTTEIVPEYTSNDDTRDVVAIKMGKLLFRRVP